MAGSDRKWNQASQARLLEALLSQSEENFEDGLRDEDEDIDPDLAGYDRACDKAIRQVKRRYLARANRDTERRDRAILALRQHHPAESQRPLPRFRGWALAQAYLQLSFEVRYSDPRAMLDYAEEACDIAFEAAPESHPPGVVFDLRVRTLAELANAYRVNERHAAADTTLEEAKTWLPQTSGDPSLQAFVVEVEASLRIEQRRLTEADELLGRAHDLYREIREHHLAGRTLISRARVAYTAGDARAAVRLLEEGLSLLERERDPRLVNTTLQALLLALVESGEYHRAAELLLESGLGVAFADEPLNALRLRWVEAKIHAGLDRLSRAEAILEEVRAGFSERGLAYDAALAGLDLAELWLRQGKPGRVLPLAKEIVATVDRLGLPPAEACRAITFVEIAAERHLTNARMIQEARDFLVRLRSEPTLVFDVEGAFQRSL